MLNCHKNAIKKSHKRKKEKNKVEKVGNRGPRKTKSSHVPNSGMFASRGGFPCQGSRETAKEHLTTDLLLLTGQKQLPRRKIC